MLGLRSLEVIIGDRVRATKLDSTTAPVIVTASSAKMRPISPGRKISGMNTATSVAVVAITAKKT